MNRRFLAPISAEKKLAISRPKNVLFVIRENGKEGLSVIFLMSSQPPWYEINVVSFAD